MRHVIQSNSHENRNAFSGEDVIKERTLKLRFKVSILLSYDIYIVHFGLTHNLIMYVKQYAFLLRFSICKIDLGVKRLTLRMLGNFLKNIFLSVSIVKNIDIMLVFYWKLYTACQTGRISGQPPSYSAAGLEPTCLHKHKCGSRTERVKTYCIF